MFDAAPEPNKEQIDTVDYVLFKGLEESFLSFLDSIDKGTLIHCTEPIKLDGISSCRFGDYQVFYDFRNRSMKLFFKNKEVKL